MNELKRKATQIRQFSSSTDQPERYIILLCFYFIKFVIRVAPDECWHVSVEGPNSRTHVKRTEENNPKNVHFFVADNNKST